MKPDNTKKEENSSDKVPPFQEAWPFDNMQKGLGGSHREWGLVYRQGQRWLEEDADGRVAFQSKLKRDGKMVFEKLPQGGGLDMVNGRRRKSQIGKEPCFDVMDAQG